MKKESMDKFLGICCKIITQEPGEERTHTLTGVISDYEQDEDVIVIDSSRGVFYLNIATIIAIKPREKIMGN